MPDKKDIITAVGTRKADVDAATEATRASVSLIRIETGTAIESASDADNANALIFLSLSVISSVYLGGPLVISALLAATLEVMAR